MMAVTYDRETLEACLAACCDLCEAYYQRGEVEETPFGIPEHGEWGHGNDDGSAECHAGEIRSAMDPDGLIMGTRMLRWKCPTCEWWFATADDHPSCEEIE